MHAMFKHRQSGDAGRPIRGTFYPSDGPNGGSVGSVVPKLIAILVAMAVLRTVAKNHHGGGRSMRSRQREAMAELHRELHADDNKVGDSVPA